MNGLLLNEDYELQIANGDFITGSADLQNQFLLLMSAKGDFKEYPTSCVGARRFLETSETSALAREIDQEFSRDGMNVKEIKINLPDISIDAEYKEN